MISRRSNLRPVIADVKDGTRIAAIFKDNEVQVVFHTAAHKHVPLMQANVDEAVLNNVFGTKNVVDAAVGSQVERLVLVYRRTKQFIRPTSTAQQSAWRK